MDPSQIISPPQPAAPPPIPEPVAQVIPAPAPVAEPSAASSFIPNKLEFLQIGLIALVASSYIMSILYYRKAIETSNSYQKLQAQVNQLKLSNQQPLSA